MFLMSGDLTGLCLYIVYPNDNHVYTYLIVIQIFFSHLQ